MVNIWQVILVVWVIVTVATFGIALWALLLGLKNSTRLEEIDEGTAVV